MKHWIALTLALLLAQPALSDEMEISISDKSIDGSYEMFFGNNFSTEISLLHTDMDNVDNADVYNAATYFFDKDGVKTNALAAAVFANGKYGNVHTRLGGKLFYIDTDFSNDMYGIALGGGVDAYVRPNLFFTGEVFYAPDIITNGDFDNYWEINGRASFQMLRNASIYIGYRLMAADFEREEFLWPGPTPIGGGTETRDFFDSLYLGFRFSL